MEQEFEALRESAKSHTATIFAKVLEVNSDVDEVIARKGVHCEYVSENDHLYIVFGQPSEGMALFVRNMVVICDPVTFELLSVEVPDFQREVTSGTLPAFAQLAEFLARQPILQVLPAERKGSEHLSRTVARAISHDLVTV